MGNEEEKDLIVAEAVAADTAEANTGQDFDEILRTAMEQDPTVARLFKSILEDGLTETSMVKAIFEVYGEDIIEAYQNNELDEYLTSRAAERTSVESTRKAQEDEWAKNLNEISSPAIEAFKDEKGLSDDQMGEILQHLSDSALAVLERKVTKPLLNAVYRDMNYDNDVQDAEKIGQTKALNKEISLAMKKSDEIGDGQPNMQSSAREKKEHPVLNHQQSVYTDLPKPKRK